MASHDPPDGARRDKGKGKSTDDGAANSGNAKPTQDTAAGPPSVFSRIAQSAAGLSRDLVTARPSGGDLASLTSTDKAGPSASRQNAQSSASGEAAFPARALPTASTRAGDHAQQHAAAQEEAFAQFLDGANIDMSLPTEPIIGLHDDLGAELVSSAPQEPELSLRALTHPDAARWHEPLPSAVAEQESRDGLDVVNLLAADGPAEEEPDYTDIELAEDEIAALKRALFGDNHAGSGAGSAQDWDNVLNFIPDFVRPNHQGYEDEPHAVLQAPSGTSAPTKSQESRAALGIAHSSETTRVWLDQWQDVLTRYDEEVWGGLSPLVSQAREEVDELQQSEPDAGPSAQPPASTKALDRLRQILGHLREDS